MMIWRRIVSETGGLKEFENTPHIYTTFPETNSNIFWKSMVGRWKVLKWDIAHFQALLLLVLGGNRVLLFFYMYRHRYTPHLHAEISKMVFGLEKTHIFGSARVGLAILQNPTSQPKTAKRCAKGLVHQEFQVPKMEGFLNLKKPAIFFAVSLFPVSMSCV